MRHLTRSMAMLSLAFAAGCAQQAFEPVPDGSEPLTDGQYTITLTAGGGHSVCQQYFPEGKQETFSVEQGLVKQQPNPYIRVRGRDIKIYGDEFTANFQGPFIVQSKVAMLFQGRRIANGFQGTYTASTGFDTCKGKFQLIR